MKDRRDFIKVVAVGAGSLSLSGQLQAQTPTTEYLPAVVSYLLDGPKVETSGASSTSVFITTFNVVEFAAASPPVSIGIPSEPIIG